MDKYYFFQTKTTDSGKRLFALNGQITSKGVALSNKTPVAASEATYASFPADTIFGAKETDCIFTKSTISVRPIYVVQVPSDCLTPVPSQIKASPMMMQAYVDFTSISFNNEEFEKKAAPTRIEQINSMKAFSCPSVTNDGFYVEPLNWSVLVCNTIEKINTLIYGPSGTGKTMLIVEIAKRLHMPINIIDCGSLHDPMSQLLGTHRLVVDPTTGQTVSSFEYAPLCDFIQKPGIVVFDEINRSNAANIFLPLLDDRRYLDVAMAGEKDKRRIPVHEGCVFFATANVGAEYSGTQAIDRALKDRFVLMELDYLPSEEEQNLLIFRHKIEESAAINIVKIANRIRHMFRSGELSIEVSTRHTLLVARYVSLGLSLIDALKFVFLPLFEKGDDDESERKVVETIFCEY